MAADWLQLPSGDVVSVASLVKAEQKGNGVYLTLNTGELKQLPYDSAAAAAAALLTIIAALPNVTPIDSPVVTSVSPTSASGGSDQVIDFHGTNFKSDGRLNLGTNGLYTNVFLVSITFIDATHMQGTLSAGALAAGTYNANYFDASNNLISSLAAAYTVT